MLATRTILVLFALLSQEGFAPLKPSPRAASHRDPLFPPAELLRSPRGFPSLLSPVLHAIGQWSQCIPRHGVSHARL